MPRTKNDFEPARLGVSATPGSLLTQLNSGIGFNRRKAAGERCDLTHCDLRNLDLRGLDAHGLDFSDTYFRNANLRGIDFSTALRSEEHTSELQSRGHLVCRLLL